MEGRHIGCCFSRNLTSSYLLISFRDKAIFSESAIFRKMQTDNDGTTGTAKGCV